MQNTSKNCQRLLRFCQSGEIRPNLVTLALLLVSRSQLYLSKSFISGAKTLTFCSKDFGQVEDSNPCDRCSEIAVVVVDNGDDVEVLLVVVVVVTIFCSLNTFLALQVFLPRT